MMRPAAIPVTVVEHPPSPGLVALGEEYMRKEGLGVPFRKRVNKRYLWAVGRAYWDAIRSHMTATKCPVATACKKAGVDPSTPTRWDKTNPHFETICLMLASSDVD